MSTPFLRPCLCLVLSLFAAVLSPAREKLPPEDLEIVEQRWPDAKKTFTGLRYVVMEPATDPKGPSPVPGEVVSVAYKGMLMNGKVFDQSDKGPLKVRLGRGNLIDGWEEALQKMRKGEKWLLIVPPELAYGAQGKPPAIKRYSTLVFEMQLLDFGPEVKEN